MKLKAYDKKQKVNISITFCGDNNKITKFGDSNGIGYSYIQASLYCNTIYGYTPNSWDDLEFIDLPK